MHDTQAVLIPFIPVIVFSLGEEANSDIGSLSLLVLFGEALHHPNIHPIVRDMDSPHRDAIDATANRSR